MTPKNIFLGFLFILLHSITFYAQDNQKPYIRTPIPDYSFMDGFDEFTIGLDSVFIDPDNGDFSYNIVAEGDSISISNLWGDILLLKYTGGYGKDEIIVMANDGFSSVIDTFTISVKDSTMMNPEPSDSLNLLLNGNFNDGLNNWEKFVYDNATADFVANNEELLVSITDGGSNAWHIQWMQTGIAIENGKKYQVKFDAYASSNRDLTCNIEMNQYPYEPYGTKMVSLTTELQSYSFEFTMNEPTDDNARVLFNLGHSNANVHIDNILLKPVETGNQQLPEANAGTDVFLTDNDKDGGEPVLLDGNGSYDPDGNITDYYWYYNDSLVLHGKSDTVFFKTGIHIIALKIMDNDSLMDTDEMVITINHSSGADTSEIVTDIDGNTYQTVTIGNQTWMAENLATSKYNDGTNIPHITSNSEWADLSLPAYCWYNNDEENYKEAYGALYNWYAVETGKLCPDGWQVPTDNEWNELKDYVSNDGHAGTEGIALKAKQGWNNEGNGTDDYGFSALPAGYRYKEGGVFYSEGSRGYWWTSTQDGIDGLHWGMSSENNNLNSLPFEKEIGFSVRCIKNNKSNEDSVSHDSLAIPYTNNSPVIDGNIDDIWNMADSHKLENVLYEDYLSNDNLSGHWKAIWDENHLYVLVNIIDNQLINDNYELVNAWNDDGIEVYIDAKNEDNSSYDYNDYQFSFPIGRDDFIEHSRGIENMGGVKVVKNKLDKGYVMEMKFSWMVLFTSTINKNELQGKNIGFDVHVNDDDNGEERDHKRSWYTVTDNAFEDPSVFGTVQLAFGSQQQNHAPIANAGNDTTIIDTDGDGFEQFPIDGSQSYDSDGNIVGYKWEKYDPDRDTLVLLANFYKDTLYLSTGTHILFLEVKDDSGATDTDQINITIRPKDSHGDSSINAFFTLSPVTGPINTVFSFDASGSQNSEFYKWDFDGDGSYDTEFTEDRSVMHTFDQPGVYHVALMVKGSDNETDTYEQSLVVSDQVIITEDSYVFEYFFDDNKDHLDGNISVVDANNWTGEHTIIAPVIGLKNGIHTLYYRFRDTSGIWSQTYNRVFLKEDIYKPAVHDFEYLEYHMNGIKGLGEGTPVDLSVTRGDSIHFVADISKLTDTNDIFLIGKNKLDQWHFKYYNQFIADTASTGIEYLYQPGNLITNIYPNPFYDETNVEIKLDRRKKVNIEIFNVKGQKVNELINAVLNSGSHTIQWQPDKSANKPGIYMVVVKTNGLIETRQVLIK